ASLTACPECGGALRKQYGSIGVTFNGSGFYRTDSRASASTSTSDSASSTSAAPSAGATSTSSSA
ncbi:MAG: FmdB family zinc ribbon protein, partial [Microbacterium gubbeenense]